MEDYVFLGVIGKPVGLKGFFKVNVSNKNYYNLPDFERVFLKTGSGFLEKEIEKVRIDKPGVIKFSGLNSREDVEAFKHKELFFLRKDVLPDSSGGFLPEDLLGLEVFSQGKLYGKVSCVDNYGSSDVVFVKSDSGEVVLPLIEGVLKEINIQEKKLYFNNIDDYI